MPCLCDALRRALRHTLAVVTVLLIPAALVAQGPRVGVSALGGSMYPFSGAAGVGGGLSLRLLSSGGRLQVVTDAAAYTAADDFVDRALALAGSVSVAYQPAAGPVQLLLGGGYYRFTYGDASVGVAGAHVGGALRLARWLAVEGRYVMTQEAEVRLVNVFLRVSP